MVVLLFSNGVGGNIPAKGAFVKLAVATKRAGTP
jgi:hypothetical protein